MSTLTPARVASPHRRPPPVTSPHDGRRRRRALVAVAALVAFIVATAAVQVGSQRTPPLRALPEVAVTDPAFGPTVAAQAGAPLVAGNRIELLLNGDEIFPAKLAAIRSARTSIAYAEYFYAEGGPATAIADALAERCRAGVAVKVLLDGVGTLSMPRDARKTMEGAGCDVRTFRPVGRFTLRFRRHNNRNHRRVLVVDGRVGLSGGSGVSEKWAGDGRQREHWRDTDVRVEGPLVADLQAAFAENWREATGDVLGGAAWFPVMPVLGEGVVAQAVRSSPGHGDYGMSRLFLLAVAGARRSIEITNPYVVPEDRLQRAIVDAGHRGVRVRVLVPGVIDHALVREAGRRHFGDLLRAGVEIHEYAPALLHSKTMVVDGVWATVGSTNLDQRSFAMNEELNVAVYDPAFAARLQRVFDADVAQAHRVTYEAWAHRPLRGRLFEWLSIPLAPVL